MQAWTSCGHLDLQIKRLLTTETQSKPRQADASLPPSVPLPSLVLALRRGGAGGWSTGAGGGAAAGTTSATMVSTAAGTLAVARAALAAAAPLSGLLVLNSRHFAPRTIIILDTAILGFLAAMRGLGQRTVQTLALTVVRHHFLLCPMGLRILFKLIFIL